MTRPLASIALSLTFSLLGAAALRADDARPWQRSDGNDSTRLADTATGSDDSSGVAAPHRTPARRLIDATYAMMEEMIAISESIRTVKDADNARQRIADAMRRMADTAEALAASDEPISMEELRELQGIQQQMQNENRFIALLDRAAAVKEEMESSRPKAAKRFREIAAEESATMTATMTGSIERMIERGMSEE